MSVHIALKNHQSDAASAPAESETPRPKLAKKSSASAQQMFGSGGSNEKKKKSLPVRKLLELERASQAGNDDGGGGGSKAGPDDDVIQSEMVTTVDAFRVRARKHFRRVSPLPLTASYCLPL